jgi:hypothetical protein
VRAIGQSVSVKRIRYLDARDARRRELAALPGGPEMVGKLEALLFERDPGGVNYEVNLDEYRPEAEKVTLRLLSARGVSDVVTILREEFMSFGVEEAQPGRTKCCRHSPPRSGNSGRK